MAEIQPFCGLRYNLERITDISSIISPPYDIITPGDQRLYHDRNPYNIIRLELGETYPSDTQDNNRYTRAANTLKQWLKAGILFQEREPAFYLFESKFKFRQMTKKRRELFARVRITDWKTGQVKPHETTMEQYKSDRFQLLKACCVNMSPVMGVIPHGKNDKATILASGLTTQSPVFHVTDGRGVEYSMWKISTQREITLIKNTLAERPIYIADGHHRYETALNYMKERARENPNHTGNEDYNYLMMSLIDEADPGLMVFPFQRLVKTTKSREEIKSKLAGIFDMEIIPSLGDKDSSVLNWLNILEERGKQKTVIGIYGLENDSMVLLTPRDRSALESKMPSGHTIAWRRLDVSLLHWIVLHEIMELDPQGNSNGNIEYIRETPDAIQRVIKGEYQFVFLLNPVSFSSVMEIADGGDRMPPKSTYFYPKPPTGMVMNPLWGCQ